MKYFLVLCIALVLLAGCGGTKKDTVDKETAPTVKNIFHDKVLRDIHDLQNQRDAAGLTSFLTNENPRYRRAAAIALASVQAEESVTPLATALSDGDESVRQAAAYALGQSRAKSAANPLIQALKKEASTVVKQHLLEALGKCGGEEELKFVIGLIPGKGLVTEQINTGRAWAIYRFALQAPKPVVSKEGTALAVELLGQTSSPHTRLIAAHYLARTREIDLEPFQQTLFHAMDWSTQSSTRMALAAALGKAKTPWMLEKIKTLAEGGVDYRFQVNLMRSLARFDYKDVKELFFQRLNRPNYQIAIAASEYFVGRGKESDARRYFETAKQLTHWRVRTNMLTAALKFMPASDKKNRKRVSDYATAAFLKTANPYEKAWLFNTLAWDTGNYMFIRSRAFDALDKQVVVSSYGIAALATIYRNAVKAGKTDEKLALEFAAIFKQAIASGDPSMISMGAGTLRDPKMKFKEIVKDTAFLSAALEKCRLPQDIEPWQELKKTIAYFDGLENEAENNAEAPMTNRAIDWQLVQRIAPDHRVRIKTSKGDILVQLKVEDSPGSVSNFLRLIREGFYKQSVFHRVVPNFVIQDGCPRGDGWGGPAYAIGSEFAPQYYGEGSVGMASAGKDTEGSQWFITHSPTPHLDGRYTIFARVIEGMGVVQRIEVGDRVLGFQEIH